MEATQSRTRNLALRRNIRRQQLDSYFQERRQELLALAAEEGSGAVLLATVGEQEQFLEESARELSGEAKGEWQPTVQRLRKALLPFRGDFEQWFAKALLSRLSRALDPRLPPALTEDVVALLADMIYCAEENASAFVRRLMEYEPVHAILELAGDRSRPLEARLGCTMLLSKMMVEEPSTRFGIIRDGGASVLVEQAREAAEGAAGEHALALLLEACHSFLAWHKSTGSSPSHMSIVYSLLPPLTRIFLREQLGEGALRLLLQSFVSMTSAQKETVYVSLYDSVGFPQRLLGLLFAGQARVRSLAGLLISYFTFSGVARIEEDLFARGAVDHLFDSCSRFPASADFAKNMLISSSNLMNSEPRCEAIALHAVCGFAVSQFAARESVEVTAEAIYFINTLVQQLRYSTLEVVLKRYDLLRLLAQGLIDPSVEARILRENLEALTWLVRRSEEVFYGASNPIIYAMENIYNLSTIADNIRDQVKNRHIEAAADCLATAIHKACLENAEAL